MSKRNKIRKRRRYGLLRRAEMSRELYSQNELRSSSWRPIDPDPFRRVMRERFGAHFFGD